MIYSIGDSDYMFKDGYWVEIVFGGRDIGWYDYIVTDEKVLKVLNNTWLFFVNLLYY